MCIAYAGKEARLPSASSEEETVYSLNQEESQAAKPFTMLAYLSIAFSDLSLLFFIFGLLSIYCVYLFVCLAALEIRLRALYKLGKHHTAKVAFPQHPPPPQPWAFS